MQKPSPYCVPQPITMSNLRLIAVSLCILFLSWTASAQTYLEKFSDYMHWKEHLPNTPEPAFLGFIEGTTPLSKKLREHWLYQLARNKDWKVFSEYYQDSTDVNLQCYAEIALVQQNPKPYISPFAKKLWLSAKSEPQVCEQLFALLRKNNVLDDKIYRDRLFIALREQNLPLAIKLLKQYTPPHRDELNVLMTIHQHPARITELKVTPLNDELYLYGLKRLVSINMEKAIQLWQHSSTKHRLNHAQQESLIAHVAFYKALRDQPDAITWYNKVEPAFYNQELLAAEVRYALRHQQWSRVENIISHLDDKETPCWQYWLARSLAAQGQREQSRVIYETLAKTRHYYGFLASLKVKQGFSFEEERTITNKQTLRPYEPFTHKVKALYLSKQTSEASRLLNDFVSELPKDDKSALIHWIDNDLEWHDKSLYLSSNEELNNQLLLRFPLPYRQTVMGYSKNYQIKPELIYAIIRQESGFRGDVVSSAGAHGLMQVMPATAKVISTREKIAYGNKNQLFSSQKNINIGVAYLKELAQRFHQHPLLMVAAYNAGPKQVSFWMQNHPPKEIDIWIETLPWRETRNYLKNVIAFYAVYQYRMQGKPDLTPFMESFYN